MGNFQNNFHITSSYQKMNFISGLRNSTNLKPEKLLEISNEKKDLVNMNL